MNELIKALTAVQTGLSTLQITSTPYNMTILLESNKVLAKVIKALSEVKVVEPAMSAQSSLTEDTTETVTE